MAEQAAALRARAQHFRRLADGMTDSATCALLKRMAREYDEQAAALEAPSGPPAPPAPKPKPRAE